MYKPKTKMAQMRLEVGKSQARVCAEMGISLPTYVNSELGCGNPSANTQRKITEYWKTDWETLQKPPGRLLRIASG